MQGDTSLIIDATRKASRFLQRDYFELEQLQSSDKKTTNFCQKACTKAAQTLHENLSKYYKTVIFDAKELETASFASPVALVETLDGFGNFARAIPFFAIMVTIVTKKNDEFITEKSLINFPALGEIYYTEKGKGAWTVRYSSNNSSSARVRASGTNALSDSLVVTNAKNFELASKLSSNIRVIDSYTYALAMLISGKADVIIFDERKISSDGVDLFSREAAGSIQKHNGSVIASNFTLQEQVKELLAK